jgi:hypothetical protein
VSVDPTGTHLDIMSSSSNSPWKLNPRVQASLDTASRPPVLRCQVRPDESAPPTAIMWGGTAPIAAARVALHNDAGAPWGQLTYDRDGARVIDVDGKTRVEITRVQASASRPPGSFALPATGAPLFHVRVVDAAGKPISANEVLQP